MMRLIKRFRDDTRGVAAIEFAFVAVPMIITFFGVAEICELHSGGTQGLQRRLGGRPIS